MYDTFFSFHKRLMSSEMSFDTTVSISEDNVTTNMNYYFALYYEEEHTDVWGLSKPSEESKGLYINYFDDQWGSPNWDPPKPDKLALE